MTDKHTPEPWAWEDGSGRQHRDRAGYARLLDANGNVVLQAAESGYLQVSPDARRRIVACVNACRGIDTKTLEDAFRLMMEAEGRMHGLIFPGDKDRDNPLALLNELTGESDDDDGPDGGGSVRA